MAFILPDHPFDPDRLTGSVIGIASALGWHDSGLHQHQRHQLLFAQAGCMSIELANRVCLLPPSRAAWLPAGTPHRVLMRGVVAYRSLYATTRAASQRAGDCCQPAAAGDHRTNGTLAMGETGSGAEPDAGLVHRGAGASTATILAAAVAGRPLPGSLVTGGKTGRHPARSAQPAGRTGGCQ
ncbi:hypothetical protein LAJPDJIK_02586 [Aeromonas salmonicida]